MRNNLNPHRLAEIVKAKRGQTPLRATSAAICAHYGDMSPSTLSRVEAANEKMPDVETLLMLADWLHVPVAVFFESEGNDEPETWTAERLAKIAPQCTDIEPPVGQHWQLSSAPVGSTHPEQRAHHE